MTNVGVVTLRAAPKQVREMATQTDVCVCACVCTKHNANSRAVNFEEMRVTDTAPDHERAPAISRLHDSMEIPKENNECTKSSFLSACVRQILQTNCYEISHSNSPLTGMASFDLKSPTIKRQTRAHSHLILREEHTHTHTHSHADAPTHAHTREDEGPKPMDSSQARGLRRAHSSGSFEGMSDKLFAEIAEEVDPEILLEKLENATEDEIRAHGDRAIIALALQTPKNKKDGRGVWLLHHQHSLHQSQFFRPQRSSSYSGEAAVLTHTHTLTHSQTLIQGPAHTQGHALSEDQTRAHTPENENINTDRKQEPKTLALDSLPKYSGADAYLVDYVDPVTNVDCSQITNLDLKFLRVQPLPLFEEALLMSRCLVGKWETLLNRSDSLDPLFKAFGIAFFKRVVVDKLPIPLTIELEDGNTMLHVTLIIPLGHRHMRLNLNGDPSVDDDPDCGQWTGIVKVGNHVHPNFNEGHPFRCLIQTRIHKNIGQVEEVRAVLPDPTYGRVLYMQFHLTTKKSKQIIICSRILRPMPLES